MRAVEECITLPDLHNVSAASGPYEPLFDIYDSIADGRFQVRDILNVHKGVSEVYLAYDTNWRSPAEHVAVKVFHEPDEVAEAYVLREIQAHQSLSDTPSVLNLIDYGTLDTKFGERHYLATEAQPATFLDEVRADRQARIDATIAMGREIFPALQVIHNSGLVHLDVKPENIFVSQDHQHLLGDFGIVDVAYDTENVPTTPLAQQVGALATGATTIGTIGFYAPERIDSPEAHPANDTFAMGGTMYLGVTGRLPFDMGNALIPSLRRATYHYNLVNESPVAPSELSSAVPANLCKLIMSCLEKDPANRATEEQAIAVLAEL